MVEDLDLALVSLIVKSDLVEFYFAREAFEHMSMRFFPHFVLSIHKEKDFRRSAQGLLEVVIEESELADWIVEPEDGKDKRKEGSGGERVRLDLTAANPEQQGDGHGANQSP